ncbi:MULTISPECIES: response regulator transcription factor [Desulfobacula]|uniref:Two component response regulator n=2 Tax=Desulfobacula TaxID=28222 RepID=K0N511_DESTT|nr:MULTISPECIES: response regulator transcription factor [Desulfobacula]CCK79214.1 two component response regulator [Desulfobacula toluolica Tol2]SDU04306.1 DNA-binding response regulator, OmpR family, contains REC and winged-helix (wHTH) domain [Desulfobacula phenolica]
METVEKKRILVIEDEAHIADGIRLNLSFQGFDVKIAADGIEGLDQWRSWEPDLIILDIMLPMIDGFSILKTIRREDEKIPVLILSARGDTKDKVKGLRYGVDDYLSKPFDLEEFLLRVERLIKKKTWYQEDKQDKTQEYKIFEGDQYDFGDNHIDFVSFKARCAAGEIVLTDQEIVLLKLFIANKGKPLSRDMLLTAGWGYSRGTSTRTVDNFIVRFRKYFEKNPKTPVHFISRRSVGYVFEHDK